MDDNEHPRKRHRGRQKGTENKDKPFRQALRMELAAAGNNHKKLRLIAKQLIANAEGGDNRAIQEIADRLDGRPAQAIEHTGEQQTFVVRMPAPCATMDEWKAKYIDVTPNEPIDLAWEEKLKRIRDDAVAQITDKNKPEEN